MASTTVASRIVGRLTTTMARFGFNLSRRLSGRPSITEAHRCLLRQCLPHPRPTVVDIGANVGQFAGEVFGVCRQAQIFSIDPIPDNIAACRRRFADKDGYRTLQAAIGAVSDQSVTFHVHPYSQASSMLPLSEAARDSFRSLQAETTVIQVPMYCLDDVVRQHGLGPIDLLKIDVEGFEAPVLRGAGQTLRDCRWLLVETQVQPMFEGAEPFDLVCAIARSAGFSISAVAAETRNNCGELLMLDLLFARSKREG